MSESPNVLVLVKFHAWDAKDRAFYSSTAKDDYLGYVDSGVKKGVPKDFMDYAGNPEKSSGVFDSVGLLDDQRKKKVRESLRNTPSVIWDAVISLREDYGQGKLRDWKEAQSLLNKELPRFFEECGMNPDAMEWYAGLHTNTDNRHIHLSFHETKPTRINPKKSRQPMWHKGKLSKKAIDRFKLRIEQTLDEPTFQVSASLREARKTLSAKKEDIRVTLASDEKLKSDLRKLYSVLPEKQEGYGHRSMRRHQQLIDRVVTELVMRNPVLKSYDEAMDKARGRDERTIESCKKNNMSVYPSMLLANRFENDFYRRVGNIVIDYVYEAREQEPIKSPKLDKDKRIRWNEKKRIGWLLTKTARLNDRAMEEATSCFDEFQRLMKKAEYERLVEEGEIET